MLASFRDQAAKTKKNSCLRPNQTPWLGSDVTTQPDVTWLGLEKTEQETAWVCTNFTPQGGVGYPTAKS